MTITNLKKTLTRVVATAALALGGKAVAQEHQESPWSFGYNAVQVAATNQESTRTRVYNNITRQLGEVTVSYHGLNQTDNADSSLYFGRHVLGVGKKGSPLEAIASVKTLSTGILATQFGIRDAYLAKQIGDFGWIDVTAGEKAGIPSANITAIIGKNLGRGYNADVFHAVEIPVEGGKWSHYTEVTAHKKLTDTLSLFGRLEMNSGSLHGSTYMVGLEVAW